ncbi:hypothetical protein DID80_03435 [Candidatus Marinamargulisbacteria bacterium SCGC AAA071-K20]|nr:hypothetical protein DID80_03435 [Candidatus Marinamargulisbacteria bacterium SCGC AAA071-K20]
MKKIFLIITSSLLLTLPTIGVERSIDTPQVQMVGARSSSLGVTNPLLLEEVSAQMINPASLGNIDTIPLSGTHKKIMGFFDYKLLNVAIPTDLRVPLKQKKSLLKRLTFGLAYGSVRLDGIKRTQTTGLFPENGSVNGTRLEPLNEFGAGFKILNLGVGTTFEDVYNFNQIAVGASAKKFTYFVDQDSSSTFGFDIGMIGVKNVDFPNIDRVKVGASVLNIFTPNLKWGNDSFHNLPLTFYLGGGVDLLNESLSLYANNGINGLVIGSEYYLQNNLILRGSSDFKTINMGTGIIFEKITTLLSKRDYSVRLDYNYTQHQFPMDTNPSHMISMSLLGESRPGRPKITSPSKEFIITKEEFVTLRGVGPRDTNIQVYNNHQLQNTTISEKFGKWKASNLKLKEGKNEIYVKSWTLDKNNSLASNKIVIYSDSTPPAFDLTIIPKEDHYLIKLKATESLNKITSTLNDQRIEFTQVQQVTNEALHPLQKYIPIDPTKTISPLKPSLWEARFDFTEETKIGKVAPKELHTLIITAEDKAGNIAEEKEIPFFVAYTFPRDRYVHYKPELRFIGFSSPMVDRILINKEPVYIDKQERFSIPIELTPGKNLVKTEVMTTSKDKIVYSMRILNLKTFPDLTGKIKGRREVEFLATLGVMEADDDGKFYPNNYVTRQYVTKLMVLSNKDVVLPEELETDPFFDVTKAHPYALFIKAAVDSGLMFAYPDGTFKPEQSLTLSETILLMSSAGLIDEVEIDEEEFPGYVTRAQLAEFLAYTPQFEMKIERLINWDTGYDEESIKKVRKRQEEALLRRSNKR